MPCFVTAVICSKCQLLCWLQGLMMLPDAALADEATAPQLLLRAWVHEAMRTLADRSTDPTTLDTVTRQVGARLLVYEHPCAEPELVANL